LRRDDRDYDRGYDDEDLHQLRVTLRRMRSFLKGRHGKKARLLRHRLAVLADITNAARDWDTLLVRARSELGPRQLSLLEPRLQVRQQAAHAPVSTMLTSPEWEQVISDWTTYIQRHPPDAKQGRKQRRGVARSEERVRYASQRTLAVDSPRNWHRLRIAVKELRYRLADIPGKARDTDTRNLLRTCKRLQDHLGDWHDTVVHLQLLQELAQDFDSTADHRALQLINKWCERIEKQGSDCLALARASRIYCGGLDPSSGDVDSMCR